MKIIVAAVMDRQMNAYSAPTFWPTEGTVMRKFQEDANDLNSPIYKHSNDYSLWRLGYFEDSTGEFTNDKEKLAEAANYKVPNPS